MSRQREPRLTIKLTGGLQNHLDLFRRSGHEKLRRDGKFRWLVLGQLKEGITPTRDDVAEALLETPPKPEDYSRQRPDKAQEHINDETAALCKYVAQAYVKGVAGLEIGSGARIRPGPKGTQRSAKEELNIAREYLAAKADNERRKRTKRTLTVIKEEIAGKFGIKIRTLEKIVKDKRAIIK